MKNTLSIKDNCVFRATYRHGKTVSKRTMAVYAMKNRREPVSRLGITVSVKLGCAVERNRMRRRIRECYRLAEHDIKQGYCIVIVARKRALYADFSELQNDLREAMSELSLL